uniref:hypothetical protein n=1 Tax=Escherichia coli TaxID=562 RepID=UPI00201B1480|nr:hypothetical protein [Escherichia coli]
MLPSEIMIWQPEFTDKILSRKPGAVQITGIPNNRIAQAARHMVKQGHLSVVERKWKTVIYAKRKVKKEPIKRNPDGTGWGCANPMTAFINRALMEVRQ